MGMSMLAVLASLGTAPLTGYVLKLNNTSVDASGSSMAVVYHPSEWPNMLFSPKEPWDWSQSRALEFDVRNASPDTVQLGIRFDDDPKADGWHHTRTGLVAVPAGKDEHVIVVFGPDPNSVGMRGLPPIPGGINASPTGDGTFDLAHIVALQFFLHNVAADTTLDISNVRTVSGASGALTGIVDAFGQFTRTDWPGKVHSDADIRAERDQETAELRRAPVLPNRDRFGGTTLHKPLKATGFFRTEKLDGKWWFVDPDGNLFFSFGIDTIQPDESTFLTGRESMFTWQPPADSPLSRFRTHVSGMHSGPVTTGEVFNFYGANLYRKFGPDYQDDWRTEALDRLRAWGFNTIGNWADERFYGNGHVPYVATGGIGGTHARLSSGSDYWSTMHDPFDPQFKTDVAASLESLIAKVKGDPWCLGYFIDNELSWAGDGPDGRYGLAVGALKAASSSPGKAALIAQLQAKYSDISDLNAAWGTSFASWDAMRQPLTLTALTDGERKDFSIFVRRLATQYFTIIRDELKSKDPDHLYLGCRFAWYGPEEEQAAADVCDVISYNIYAPRLDAKWDRVAAFGKPCIIGEFHFGALDRGMFHPGLVSTPNQAARAAMYEDYVGSVLRNPSFIGCHWFQYTDEPLTGRSWDGENYNIGFVAVTDTPYPELLAAAKKIQAAGYALRLGK